MAPQLAAALFRRRDILALFVALGIVLSILTISSPPLTWSRYSTGNADSGSPDSIDSFITDSDSGLEHLEVLAQLYEDERISLLSDYDQAAAEAIVRSPPGSLNPDFNAYMSRLEDFVDDYFNNTASYPMLKTSLANLITARPPPLETKGFEKTVYSFDKAGRQGVPWEFEYWDRRLGGEGWEIKVGDDERMEEWFNESVGEDLESAFDEGTNGAGMWHELWDGIPRPVLKSDILRYLMMVTRGGMYTDSDTAPLSDPNLWGYHAHVLTPPSLRVLQQAMRQLDPARGGELADDLESESAPVAETSLGINNPKVSMVISVEYDLSHPRQDPRTAYTRDLQMVQWTFLAKPYHPIFLDVLETASTEILARRSNGNDGHTWQDVLDVTGPGPFTDAVLRYLLVQYGVTPQRLQGMEDGALIGDILILPLHAFGSYLGGEENWNEHDPSTRCTAHGFRGRWKGERALDRRHRW